MEGVLYGQIQESQPIVPSPERSEERGEYRSASGNVTDDTTHRENWELLCQIAGRKDFLYVADCKLATIENMNDIAGNGGRFVSVLPRTRKEDAAFRQRVEKGEIVWRPLWNKTNDQGEVVDRFSVSSEAVVLPEGYRLWWFHSTRKAELDLAARSGRLQRAEGQLRQLLEQLRSPRSRQRDSGKVQDRVTKILQDADVADWIRVEVHERAQETYRQQKRGRPGKDADRGVVLRVLLRAVGGVASGTGIVQRDGA
jgi:transposase